jgi:hypothetical protein
LRRSLQASGDALPGDRLLLMTDALSRWFLTAAEAGEQPWLLVENMLGQPDERFAEWVGKARAARLLRNDDTTLVAVCF